MKIFRIHDTKRDKLFSKLPSGELRVKQAEKLEAHT
jgi:hypothetical protein